MICKNIAGTTLNASCICLGTAELGTVMSQTDSFSMLDFFTARGGNFLDSAHVYGDMASAEKGMSEKTIGKWIKERKNRDGLIVSTKGGHPSLASMQIPRLARQDIMKDIDESLANLGLDCIDLYWLHRDDPGRDAGEIVETMNELVRLGKIRFYGFSNWRFPRFAAALDYARLKGYACPVASQVLWSLAEPVPGAISDPTIAMMDPDARQYYRKENIAVIPFTSQARGFFTKLRLGLPMQDWVAATYRSPENMARYDRAARLAESLGISLEAVVLAYLTNQRVSTIPIISARNNEQLAVSLGAADLVLPGNSVDELENG